MCHGNSENSDDCLYLRIFLIYGTNVSVSQSRIPLQVYQQTNASRNTVHVKTRVSFESLAGNDFSERGTQAEAHCERIFNRQL